MPSIFSVSANFCHFATGQCGAVSFPEAERIEPVKCRLNLLHHVQAVQDTIEHAYDAIEDQLRSEFRPGLDWYGLRRTGFQGEQVFVHDY